jgi:Family of unknown function (DUF6600)
MKLKANIRGYKSGRMKRTRINQRMVVKMRNMIKIFAMILTVLGVLGAGQKGFAREINEVDGPVPWVSHIAGQDGALMIKQADTDWFDATINTPIGEGDMVWQSNEGRSEVFIDRGTYLRLDRESGIEFVELSNRQIRVGVTSGTIEASNKTNQPMLIDVPGQTLIVNQGAKVRINVDDDGVTEIMTKRGKVDSDGPNGQVRVKAGQTLVSSPEGKVIRLTGAYRTNDFDNWTSRRDKDLSRGSGPPTATASYLPEPALAQMAENGTWINDAENGWVWQPRVSSDWAPYREGRWVQRPNWGWTWVSYEPWGWYPHHYGRWVRVHSNWCWRPVHVRAAWSPALVFWVEGPQYIAWQPLPLGVSLSMVVNLGPTLVVSRYVNPHCITMVGYHDFHRGYYSHYNRSWSHHHHSHYTVVRSPVHVYRRSGHGSAHYRSSRPSGYVHHSRRPNDKVVYAHRRTGTNSSRSSKNMRVDYGSKNMPRKNYKQRPVHTASRANTHLDSSTKRRVNSPARDVNPSRKRSTNDVTNSRQRSKNDVTTNRNKPGNDMTTSRKRSNNDVTNGRKRSNSEVNTNRNRTNKNEWRSGPMPENYKRPDTTRSRNGANKEVSTANNNQKQYRPDNRSNNSNKNVKRNSNGNNRSKEYRPERSSNNRKEVSKSSNTNRNSSNRNDYEKKARKANNNDSRNSYDAPKKEYKEKSDKKEKSSYKKSSSRSSGSSRSSVSKSSSRSSSSSSSHRSSGRSSSSRSSSRRSPR